MMDKNIKILLKGSFFSFIGLFSNKFFLLLTQILIARALGPTYFGFYVLCITIVKLSIMLSQAGLRVGGMRYATIYLTENDYGKVREVLFISFLISFLCGLISAIIIILFANFISIKIFHIFKLSKYLKIIALSIPFYTSAIVMVNITQAKKTTIFKVLGEDLLFPFINLLFVIIFLFNKFDLYKAIYSFLISSLLFWGISLFFYFKVFEKFLKPLKLKFSLRNSKPLLFFSIPLLFNNILHYLLANTDILMLGYFSSSKQVGFYRAASQIALTLTFFLSAINTIYAPIITEKFVKKSFKEIDYYYKVTTKWIWILTLPLFLLIVKFPTLFLEFYGKKFLTSSDILIVLSLAYFINSITGSSGYTLSMLYKHKIELMNSIFLLLINILLNVLFIPKYGGLGAAIATLISTTMINLLRLIEIHFFFKIFPYNVDIFKLGIFGLICFIILYLIKIKLIVLQILTMVIFVCFYFIFVIKFFLGEEKKILTVCSHNIKLRGLL